MGGIKTKEKKRGQATFLPAFVAGLRLRSIDVRVCAKYEKKAACSYLSLSTSLITRFMADTMPAR